MDHPQQKDCNNLVLASMFFLHGPGYEDDDSDEELSFGPQENRSISGSPLVVIPMWSLNSHDLVQ